MTGYKITYEVLGKQNVTAYVVFWSENITQAIKDFENWQQDTNGFKWNYTQHSIVSIELY